MSSDPDVLIVGAGPTGLVLALWLTRLGIPVRIIDKTAEPGTTSRALAVQARTLEFYRQIGIADEVIARGRQVSAAQPVGRRPPRRAISSSATSGAASAPIPTRSSFRRTSTSGC